MSSIKEKQLRQFGWLVGGIFLLLAVLPALTRHASPRTWALVVGGALTVLGTLAPKGLGPVYRVWMAIGHVLGYVNTRLILALMFYGVFTPLGLLIRLFGRDPMNRAFDKTAATYREPKAPRPPQHFLKQF
jgi:hypothetical protein